MRVRRFLLVACCLCVVVFAGCGRASVPPSTSTKSFLYADGRTLALLVWSQSVGHYRLNGSSSAMTVQVQGNVYTFHIGRGVLTGTLSQKVLLTRYTDEQRRVAQHVWYPGSAHDYSLLFSSLTAYLKVQQAQQVVQSLERLPQLPDNSRPSFFQAAVHLAQQRVQDERMGLRDVKGAGRATCSVSAGFLTRFPSPTSDPRLQVPFSQQESFSAQDRVAQSVINRSVLVQAIQALTTAYQDAKALPLASVSGLPLLWVTVPTYEMEWGTQHVQALAQQVQADVTLYTSLQYEAQQLRQQVEQIQQTAFCTA